ncbi:TPA: recombinase family protein [Candidatus Scatousia excrementigallinarum]|uniref:Recombinase family protein n=1 Tax=Candidatus Scatousia excrementigallinarum TaxID=2840935 RepID=A0A9D1F0I1_9BACT|nr:recombinase family protein [Candidatus Scatousia excrementigallinarum]
MIKDAEKGLFKYIICYQTARFARNTYDAIVYKKKLKKFGVKVIYFKMSIPEGPESRHKNGTCRKTDRLYRNFKDYVTLPLTYLKSK